MTVRFNNGVVVYVGGREEGGRAVDFKFTPCHHFFVSFLLLLSVCLFVCVLVVGMSW